VNKELRSDPPADTPKAFNRDACSTRAPGTPPSDVTAPLPTRASDATARHLLVRVRRQSYDATNVVNDVFRSQAADRSINPKFFGT
jgi:hypothetical protein